MTVERKPLTLREIERLAILDALERNGGSKKKACRELGMSRATFYRRWKGITRDAENSSNAGGVGADRDHPGDD